MLNKLFGRRYAKFDPAIDQLTSDDEKAIDQITADIRDYIGKSDTVSKINYHTRDAHAKGYCALKANFEILPKLPKEYAQGIYAKPARHEAVIRFSNGSSRVAADNKLGLSQGLAIKVFGVKGEKLLPDEPDSPNFDYNLINFPIFFCNTIQDYSYISRLFLQLNDYFAKGAKGQAKFAFDWVTQYGKKLPSKESLKTFRAFSKFKTIKPQNTLLYSFYSQGAVRHGDYMAKIRVAPTKASQAKIKRRDLDVNATSEAIRPLILQEIREHDYEFDVQIQLCRNLKDQPINDLTKEWDEKDAPFVTVAKLTIPCQDVPDDGNFDIMEHLSFTPFRCIEANRPIGNLQHARLRAYQTASTTRHSLNNKKRVEPTNLKEAFDKDFYNL